MLYDREEDSEYDADEMFAECCREIVQFQEPEFDIVVAVFDEGPYLAVTFNNQPIEAVFVGRPGFPTRKRER